MEIIRQQNLARIITHHIKGIEDVLLENKDENDKNKDDKDVENKELNIEIKNCNVGSWSNNLVQKCRKTLEETTIKCDMANPYYIPQLSDKLRTFLSYFPLYSGIMISIFGSGKINESSSAVKSEMNDIKHILLKNKSRPMRADKFVTTHLSSFVGRSLLAMSTHDTILFAKNNDKVTENNNFTNKSIYSFEC